MIVFDDLTVIFGGTPRRAKALGAHYVEDDTMLALRVRHWYPNIRLVREDGRLVDVEKTVPEQTPETAESEEQ